MPKKDTPFDLFTERARLVMTLATEEARSFHHDYLGTEHLLLALLQVEDGAAARVLKGLGVEIEKARAAIEFVVGRGTRLVAGELALTPRAKRTLSFAMEEARRLRHGYIGTEHLLLGLLREGEGVAAGVLTTDLGIQAEEVRQVVALLVSNEGSPKSNVVTCRVDDRDLAAIDSLVEAGIRTTRSEAAAWLIHAGIDAHRELFERVRSTVEEIRRLRAETQTLANEIIAGRSGATRENASPAKDAD